MDVPLLLRGGGGDAAGSSKSSHQQQEQQQEQQDWETHDHHHQQQQHEQPSQQPAQDDAATAAHQQQQQPEQQAAWYQLDERGKIASGYDERDWFLPSSTSSTTDGGPQPPFKRRAGVAAGMAGRAPHAWKRVRQLLAADGLAALPADVPTFVSLEAPPPLYPPKRYCDVTGCEAPYTDPKTHLRYANAAAFAIGRSMGGNEVQARLAVRGAATTLK